MLSKEDIKFLTVLYHFKREVTAAELKKAYPFTKAQFKRLEDGGYLVGSIDEGENSSFIVTVSITTKGYGIIKKAEAIKKFV